MGTSLESPGLRQEDVLFSCQPDNTPEYKKASTAQRTRPRTYAARHLAKVPHLGDRQKLEQIRQRANEYRFDVDVVLFRHALVAVIERHLGDLHRILCAQ